MAFELLTTTQAGSIAGVDGHRIGCFIRAGQLPASRVGSIWLVNRRDLDHFLATTTITRGHPRSKSSEGPGWAARALVDLDGEPATPEELAVLVGRHPGNVRKHLLLLAAVGHAERRVEGWVLTEAGRSAYRSEAAA